MSRASGASVPPLLQVAVFGAGSFGQNHIRVYRQLQQSGHPVHLAAIVDPAFQDPAQAELTGQLFASTPAPLLFTGVEQCLAALASGQLQLHAASVCTPTSTHAAVAGAALAAGLHVLIEKPLTRTLAEADTLLAAARSHHRIVQVGHLERFNPAVQAFLPHLNRPMFFEAHRLSVFTPRSLDVDVVLDLMVHDLDVVLTFAQSPVREIRAVGLPILSRRTDIANVRVEFESGCVANFTASRVSTERVRKLRFFQPRQYVSIDYARQEILLIEVEAPASATATAGAPSPTHAFVRRGGPIAAGDPFSPPHPTNAGAPSKQSLGGTIAAGDPLFKSAVTDVGAPSPTPTGVPAGVVGGAVGPLPNQMPGLKITKPPVTQGEPLRLEIESFLNAIHTGTRPVVSGEDGRAALSLALDITAAIEAHLERTNLQTR